MIQVVVTVGSGIVILCIHCLPQKGKRCEVVVTKIGTHKYFCCCHLWLRFILSFGARSDIW